MEKTVLKCSSGDDLIMYARKTAALGRVVEELSFLDSECLCSQGQEIGLLISDLSKLIESELTALYKPIENAYSGSDNSFLAELNEKMEMIQQGAWTPDGTLAQTKDSIKKIVQFIDKDVSPILSLRIEFEKIEADINRRLMGKDSKKGAAEGIADQPAAQEPDMNKSNSEGISHK